MSAMASQITGVSIVCSAVCSGADQRKIQSPASLASVRWIHRWPVDSPHKGPVTRKMFPFDDIIMDRWFPYEKRLRTPAVIFQITKIALTDHYDDVIMDSIASQITSLTIVYSTVHSGADQSKHQSSASLAFVWEIHRWPVNFPHKWPVTRKMFPFDDVIMFDIDIQATNTLYIEYTNVNSNMIQRIWIFIHECIHFAMLNTISCSNILV